MKQQYLQIKEQYNDCLLFFRLGDFYEMFDDDARLASEELDLALTTRDRGKPPEEQTPMCGVPYHSAEAYIGRLIAKGYKIAICEQKDDPALTKGLLTREVVRVITPGTVTDSSMLPEARGNYICSVCLSEAGLCGAVCFAELSTGEFFVSGFSEDATEHIINELGRFSPSEAVLNECAERDMRITAFITGRLEAMPEYTGDTFDYELCTERICRQFSSPNVENLGFRGPDSDCSVRAAGALLEYLEQTQKLDMSHISKLEVLSGDQYMELDYTAIRSLELTQNLRTGEKKGSLLWVLDRTRTSMGARMLRGWVERPLLTLSAINKRLDAVAELYGNTVLRGELAVTLSQLGDMRRLTGRAVYGTANGRDLRTLGSYFAVLPRLCALLSGCGSRMLRRCAQIDTLGDLERMLSGAICPEPPFSVREGGILADGYDEEVDRLRRVKNHGADMVRELEERERERTGIKKLRTGYNKVFGFYIDIPRSAGEVELPPEYIRRQTLANSERYFTVELKELEDTLTTAGDRLCELEYELFTRLRESVASQVERIQAVADRVAELDCLYSLAEVAVRNGYCMPEVDSSHSLHIIGGRHPVVEVMQKDSLFVANDTYLDTEDESLAIVTGPNMAGKSTYMRQTALIALMAQMGSFVPAESARVGIIDRVFTRIGASDDLASGQSTFMVEMSEVAEILRHATSSSLLILDEIGRGTSTYDGMAIARALLEYCADKKRLGAKTMFATHYHELSALEGLVPGVKNYSISAKKRDGQLIFLRRIVPGAADDSYGIEVARLAGVPEDVVARARDCLSELESGAGPDRAPAAPRALPAQEVPGADEVCRRLRRLDLNVISPIEAFNLLFELKRKVEEC